MYYLYVLLCADGTLYTGIALDIKKRVGEHNTSDKLGARYTRSRRPVRLVYSKEAGDEAAAKSEEYRFKQLPRLAKLTLCGL
ncbi:MAG: GIY-YIG nuclease family protein [Candidatus Adlerbacteria bacterium]|nr:GIY-YIG nuclease family protein [Candidatus Adlerbacteria bacterium]MDZ4226056.1 GIY-YIG nuclease family protein [Patescibacteria group bacterium]